MNRTCAIGVAILVLSLSVSTAHADGYSAETKEFLRLHQNEEAGPYFRKLSDAKQVLIAKELLSHKDGRLAYFAATTVYRSGDVDSAMKTFADILATGRDKTDLNGRMGYDWIHSDDPRDGLIFSFILKYVAEHVEDYKDEEQRKRLDAFLTTAGISSPPTKEELKRIRDKLQEEEARIAKDEATDADTRKKFGSDDIEEIKRIHTKLTSFKDTPLLSEKGHLVGVCVTFTLVFPVDDYYLLSPRLMPTKGLMAATQSPLPKMFSWSQWDLTPAHGVIRQDGTEVVSGWAIGAQFKKDLKYECKFYLLPSYLTANNEREYRHAYPARYETDPNGQVLKKNFDQLVRADGAAKYLLRLYAANYGSGEGSHHLETEREYCPLRFYEGVAKAQPVSISKVKLAE